MTWLIIWLAFSFAVGVFANNRGRSGGGWFLLSILISPILAFIFVAVMQDLRRERQRKASAIGPDTHVKCPSCAEWVLPEAKVCKHCGGPLEPAADFKAVRAKAVQAAKKDDANNLAIGVAFIFGLFVLAAIISKYT
jgi:ribosomal protein L32